MQTLPAREAYDIWSETYPPFAHNPLMEAEQTVVVRHLSTIRATSALDVGTGSGRYASLLAATGAHTIVGLDLSVAMLQHNGSRLRVCANALSLPLPSAAFDLVNASLMAGDIANLAPWLAEMARVLEPGGHLLYSDFHPFWDLRGWQRTFRTRSGEEVALPRASHQIHEHLFAINGAGLELVASDEVSITQPRRFRQPRTLPVAMVFHARKAVK